MSGPLSPTALRAANEWLVRLRDERVTADDHAAFETWLCVDPRHGVAFAHVSAQVSDIGALGGALYAHLEARSGPARFLNRRTLAGAGLAATALLALAWLGVGALSPPAYTTAIGEQRTVELADGSTIELNTNSRVVVRLTEETRQIRLTRGEAVFDVAHDPGRPFIVEAAGQEVRAVGTQFAVRVDGETLSVLVAEGVVSVATDHMTAAGPARETAPTRLVAGERLALAGGAVEVAVLQETEIERNLTWRAGMLQFDGQTLAEAVEEVSRYTGARFVISDPQVGTLRVWAYFRAADLDGFLAKLEQNNPSLEIRRAGDAVEIARRPE